MDTSISENRLSFVKDKEGTNRAMREPNVLGWKVVDSDRRTIGYVDNMLVDTKEDRARYIDIELDKTLVKEGQENYGGKGGEGARDFQPNHDEVNVLVPIGMLHTDDSEKVVVADNIDRTTLMQIPRHRPGSDISFEHERQVRFVFDHNEGKHGTDTVVKPESEVAFKSEHYTKGNENMGSRDPGIRRDVVAEDEVKAEMKSRDRGEMMAKEGGRENTKVHSESTTDSPGGTTPPANPQASTAKADAQIGKADVTTNRPGETVGVSETEGTPGAEPRKRMQDQKNEMENTSSEGHAAKNVRDKDFYAGDKYNEDRFYNRSQV